MENKKEKYLTSVLFAIYFLLLIWIILFKGNVNFEFGYYRKINLIPFGGSLIVNGKLQLDEIIQNILIFVPFGIYICMLKPKWSFIKKVMPAFFTSLVVEILQYILAIGATDITDLIGNTLGGIIGIGIFYIFKKLLKERTNNIIKILASITTIIVVSIFALVVILNK